MKAPLTWDELRRKAAPVCKDAAALAAPIFREQGWEWGRGSDPDIRFVPGGLALFDGLMKLVRLAYEAAMREEDRSPYWHSTTRSGRFQVALFIEGGDELRLHVGLEVGEACWTVDTEPA